MSKILIRLFAAAALSVAVASADSVLFSMPTDLIAAPNSTVTLPVSILNLSDSSGNAGLSAADLVLTYDTSDFTVSNSDISEGPLLLDSPAGSTWTFVTNTATLGEIDISLSSPSLSNDITATSGDVFADIVLHVLASAPNGDSTISIVIPPALSPNGLNSDAMPDSGPNSIQGDAAGYSLNASDQVDGVVDIATPEPVGLALMTLAAGWIWFRRQLRRLANGV